MTIMVTIMVTIMYVERADSMRDARVKRLDDEGWLARNDNDDNDDDVITISGSDKGCRYTVSFLSLSEILCDNFRLTLRENEYTIYS